MTNEERIAALESLLYDAVVELEYVQCVENCTSELCASANGADIVAAGMKLLGVKDLSEPSLKLAEKSGKRVAVDAVTRGGEKR